MTLKQESSESEQPSAGVLSEAQLEARRAAMHAFVGIRGDRPEFDDVESYIRNLRGETA